MGMGNNDPVDIYIIIIIIVVVIIIAP